MTAKRRGRPKKTHRGRPKKTKCRGRPKKTIKRRKTPTSPETPTKVINCSSLSVFINT